MEQKMRFGLLLGRLAILKKKKFGPIMNNFWGRFFHVFGCKKNEIFFWKCCSIRTEKLHNINLRTKLKKKKIALKTWKKRPQIVLNSQSIVYCSIGDTSLRDFYIMTLVRSTYMVIVDSIYTFWFPLSSFVLVYSYLKKIKLW